MTVMIEAAVAGALAARSSLEHSAAAATWPGRPLSLGATATWPSRPLSFAALATWLIDAISGAYMLGTWIARGGLHQQRTTGDRLAPRVVFGHFGIATTGLLVWVSFLVTGWLTLAWLAVGLLMLVIGLGISTVTLWTPFPAHRADAGPAAGAAPATGDHAVGALAPGEDALAAPAEDPFTSPLTDEMLNRALTDEVLLSQLVDDVVAGVRAGPRRSPQTPGKHLTTIIPAGHGVAAIATFLLAVLTAAGAS
jgi:hypothetical protein